MPECFEAEQTVWKYFDESFDVYKENLFVSSHGMYLEMASCRNLWDL